MRLMSLALALFASLPLGAHGQSPEGVARIDVLPGWTLSDGRQMAALRITLAPGWKTYWRSPGDAGIPPLFDWAGSRNLAGVALRWPTPEVFDLNGMRSIGYHDGIVLPIEIAPRDRAAPVALHGSVEMGVCLDICVPVQLEFDADLTPQTARNPEIVSALVDQPLTGAEAGAGKVTCAADPIRDGLRVTVGIDLPQTGAPEVVVIESGQDRVWTSEASATRSGDRIVAVADMIPVDGQAFALDRSAVRITVLGRDAAVDLRGCVGG